MCICQFKVNWINFTANYKNMNRLISVMFFVFSFGLVCSSQDDKSFYIGGTMSARYQLSKQISNSPWNNEPLKNSYFTFRPEIGLASGDLGSFYGFGLGISASKTTSGNQNISFLGATGGAYYRRTLSKNRFLSPYAELGLNLTFGQNKTNNSPSEYFSSGLFGKIGLMHFTEKSWIFLMGVSILSVEYERFSSQHLFRAGLQNAGTFSFSVIRVLGK